MDWGDTLEKWDQITLLWRTTSSSLLFYTPIWHDNQPVCLPHSVCVYINIIPLRHGVGDTAQNQVQQVEHCNRPTREDGSYLIREVACHLPREVHAQYWPQPRRDFYLPTAWTPSNTATQHAKFYIIYDEPCMDRIPPQDWKQTS